MAFPDEFRKLNTNPCQTLPTTEDKRVLPNLFYRGSLALISKLQRENHIPIAPKIVVQKS